MSTISKHWLSDPSRGARRVAAAAAAQLAFLLVFAGAASAQDQADQAWLQGDTQTARRLYAERLAADSTDDTALHRMALLLAWNREYAEGIALFDRLLAQSNDNVDAATDRARVMVWSGDTAGGISALTSLLEAHPDNRSARRSMARIWAESSLLSESASLYDSLVRSNPADIESRLGLARVLSWSDQVDSAAVVYAGILAERPRQADALAGWARMASWSGDMVEAEVRWRQATSANPLHAPSWIGLGRTLRSQGRTRAAHTALAESAALDPGNSDVAAELEEIRASERPTASSRLGFESDSDGNRILTGILDAEWSASHDMSLRATVYGRHARQVGTANSGLSAVGVRALVTTQFEPGWTLTGGLGASGTTATGSSTTAALSARVTTPDRHRVRGSVGVTTQALDETAALIRNAVTYTTWDANLSVTPASAWRISAGLSLSEFDGSESNERLAGWVEAHRTVSNQWRVGVVTRSFGFEKNLSDGYFDPDHYLLSQVPVEWSRAHRKWQVRLRVAPGVQRVGRSGSLRTALGLDGQLHYELSPSREIGAWVRYARTGLASFSTESSDYRYVSLGLRGSWRF